MKRILALGLTTVFAMPILSTVNVFAEESVRTPSKTTTTATTYTAPATDTDTEKPDTPEELKALADRVQKRKTELKTKLTNAEKLRLQTKCKGAQGQISSIKGRIKGIETSRSEVYKNVIKNLTALSEKLKNKGVNTNTLNADISLLKTKIDTFNTDLAMYKQDVGDLPEVDCKVEAEGFKASLDTARADLQKVNQDSLAVKSYLHDTIKPLLVTIRAELASNKPTNSTTKPGGNQ